MEGSTLRLIVEKGPKGETVDCKAGVIKIGRVMKGNTFGIRDSGISSNHLIIEFKASKWVISDLGSSNGTFLNDKQITAFTDFDLRDEDIIKIGERTSLKVQIIEEIRVSTKPPTRNGKKNVEVVDLEEEEQVRRNPRRRAAPKNFTLAPVSSVPAASGVVESRPKRGRPRKVAYDEAEEILKVPQAPEPKVPPISESVKEIGAEKPENVILEEPKKTRGGGTRRGRGRKQEMAVPVLASEKLEVSENVAVKPVNTVELSDVIVGQNSRLSMDEEKHTLDDVCDTQKSLLTLSIDQNLRLEKCEEEEKVVPVARKKRTTARRAAQQKGKANEDVRIPDLEEDASNPKEPILQEEIRQEFASTSDGGVNCVVKGVKEHVVEENKVDFEKMTLGEWFDYVEVYFPKQLRKTTKEIVSNMRERSRQFSEFMAEQQQKDGKGKHPAV